MIKSIITGLVIVLSMNGIVDAQLCSTQTRKRNPLTLHEAAEFAEQIQAYVLSLKEQGLSDEQICKVFENQLLNDPSLVSAGTVVKTVLGCIGVVVAAGAIGFVLGVALGVNGNRLENDIRREILRQHRGY